MIHTLLITLHAAAGVGALALGLYLARNPARLNHYVIIRRLYMGGLVTLVVCLLAAVIVDWSHFDGVERGAFTGLSLLGLYTLWRGFRGVKAARAAKKGWQGESVDHVGFTSISLFAGFVIVGAIDLKAPGWLVGLIAAAAIFGGIRVVNYLKNRVVRLSA